MCEVLMELFSDKFEEKKLEEIREKVQIKLIKGKSIDQIADELEEDVDIIKNIIEKLQNKEVTLL